MNTIPEKAPYIRESWYPASWADELGSEPLARKFLDEDIVLYRTDEGEPVALANACPHRFAKLSKGRIHGSALACPYHGLRFAPDGQCSLNPHGPTPKAVRVRSYPLAERYGMIWIWMGASENADPSKLPLITDREDERFEWVTGYLHVQGNYQLVIDNLLDLTHVEFMHPFLSNVKPDDRPELRFKSYEDGDQIVSRYYQPDIALTQLVGALWDEAPERISMVAEMRWNAPANLVQENRFDVAEEVERCEGVVLIPFCHLLTPETASSTHYFWGSGRNQKVGIVEVSQGLQMGISATFANEDEPMIADIQDYVGDQDLLNLKPLLLPIDKSAVLARRRVAARIAQEATAAGGTMTVVAANA